jgi:hypothetical protein
MFIQECTTTEFSIGHEQATHPEIVVGRRMSPTFYIRQEESKKDLGQRLTSFNKPLLASRGLERLTDIPADWWGRVNCLPTAALVAINLLLGTRVLGTANTDQALPSLYDFYTTGVLCHINDLLGENDVITQKGFPSFHREHGETYHQFVVSFARRYGLDGMLLTNFDDVSFFSNLIQAGCVIILSVDNLFIQEIVTPNLQLGTLSATKHAEIFHGATDVSLTFTDVYDQRNGASWNSLNLACTPYQVNQFLTCPRRGDYSTRAIMLFPKSAKPSTLTPLIPNTIKATQPPEHPILSKLPHKSIKSWNERMEELFMERGLAQWQLAAATEKL